MPWSAQPPGQPQALMYCQSCADSWKAHTEVVCASCGEPGQDTPGEGEHGKQWYCGRCWEQWEAKEQAEQWEAKQQAEAATDSPDKAFPGHSRIVGVTEVKSGNHYTKKIRARTDRAELTDDYLKNLMHTHVLGPANAKFVKYLFRTNLQPEGIS